MQLVRVVRTLLGRTGPEVVIQTVRRRAVGLVADRVPPFVAQALGHVDMTELATMQELHRVLNSLVAAALRPRLDDPPVLPRGLDHAAAFGHVVADRLPRRKRPCPPGTPRSSPRRASGSAWRSTRRRCSGRRRLCGGLERTSGPIPSSGSTSFVAGPMTLESASQIVVIRTVLVRRISGDMLHPAPSHADDRDPQGLRSARPSGPRPRPATLGPSLRDSQRRRARRIRSRTGVDEAAGSSWETSGGCKGGMATVARSRSSPHETRKPRRRQEKTPERDGLAARSGWLFPGFAHFSPVNSLTSESAL